MNEGAVIRAVCAPRSFAMNPDDCLVKSCVCSNDRLLMTPVIRGVLFFLPAPGRRARSLRPLGALQPCSVGGLGLLRLRPAGMAAQAAPPAPGWPPCSRLRTSAGSPATSARPAPAAPPPPGVMAASLGKMPTTRVRRLIYSLTRLSRLVLQTFRQCWCGKWRNASTSSLA